MYYLYSVTSENRTPYGPEKCSVFRGSWFSEVKIDIKCTFRAKFSVKFREVNGFQRVRFSEVTL